jgi:uncharacterized membrane protein YgdD (TMEM256/DUF423 family)
MIGMDSRRTLAAAGVLLALATALGAFGAHALKTHLPPERLQVYETAVRYHFLNALGLLAIGITIHLLDSGSLRWAAVLVVAGILLFSGSLYALTFGAPRAMGLITPFGGLALIAGWLLFAISVWRQ